MEDSMDKRRIFAFLSIMFICFSGYAACSDYVQWSVPFKGIGPFLLLPGGNPALAADNRVVALNDDGSIVWEWSAQSEVVFLASDTDGALFAASGDKLVKLDKGGEVIWSVESFGAITALAVIEGNAYVGWEHGLFALDEKGKLSWEYQAPEDC
jgi:hypothetical protein